MAAAKGAMVVARAKAMTREAKYATAIQAGHHPLTADEARIERILTLNGAFTEEQRARMADIAERTPVTLATKAGVGIRTELR